MASSAPSQRTSMQSAPSPTVLSSMMALAVGVGIGLRVVTSISRNTSSTARPEACAWDQPVIRSATMLR